MSLVLVEDAAHVVVPDGEVLEVVAPESLDRNVDFDAIGIHLFLERIDDFGTRTGIGVIG